MASRKLSSDLGDFRMSDFESSEYDRLMLAKGEALHCYALMENGLALLFGILSGMPAAKSDIVFYRIASTRTRNTIISDLFSKSKHSKYKTALNSIITAVGQLDEQRNQIAHWHAHFGTPLEADPEKIKGIGLRNPSRNIFDNPEGSPLLSYKELRQFGKECLFWSKQVTEFLIALVGSPAHGHRENLEALREKFLQPIQNPFRTSPAKKRPLKNAKPKRQQKSSPE